MNQRERATATMKGGCGVFLIGVRLNKPWLEHKCWPCRAR